MILSVLCQACMSLKLGWLLYLCRGSRRSAFVVLDEQDEVLERELFKIRLDLVHYGSGYVLVHAILVNKVETFDYFFGADGA